MKFTNIFTIFALLISIHLSAFEEMFGQVHFTVQGQLEWLMENKGKEIINLLDDFSKLDLTDKLDFIHRLEESIFVIGYMKYSNVFNIDDPKVQKFIKEYKNDNQDESSSNFEYTNFLVKYHYFLYDHNILEPKNKNNVSIRLAIDQEIIKSIKEPNSTFPSKLKSNL